MRSVAGRTGAVTLTSADVSSALGYAQLPAALQELPIALVMPGKPGVGRP